MTFRCGDWCEAEPARIIELPEIPQDLIVVLEHLAGVRFQPTNGDFFAVTQTEERSVLRDDVFSTVGNGSPARLTVYRAPQPVKILFIGLIVAPKSWTVSHAFKK